MPLGILFFIAWLVFMVITTGAFIFWAWKEDQFSNEANLRVLIDREPEPWPGREKNKGKQSNSSGTSANGGS